MSNERVDIQGLRGWAIILVVLFHFFPDFFPKGHLGMDMLKQILPLYYLALTCGLIALFAFCPPSYWAMNITSSRKAVALIANFKTAESAAEFNGRLLQNADDLFTHTWSLCVEIQWYLLAPLMFLAQRQAATDEKKFFAGSKYLQNPGLAFLPSFLTFVTIPISILQLPLTANALRLIVTALSAVLIYVGNYHKAAVLYNPILVFVGDISYSLYLFHWPLYVVFRSNLQLIQNGFLFIMVLSFIIAAASHQFFEKNYLKYPPNTILSLIAVLFLSSTLLAMQSNDAFESEYGSGTVDYSTINIDDAGWNMTLMRLLNAKENDPQLNIENRGCNYTNRFTDKAMKPYGFCSMEDGTGEYDMLVIGNNYACNQGEVVYNAFKKHAKKFNVFCLEDCELLTRTSPKICKEPLNYTAIVEELRPDVVFLISRAISAKVPYESNIDDDKILKEHRQAVNEIELIVKKLYILQALPSCVPSCSKKAQEFIRKGAQLYQIDEGLIARDDHFARVRIQELARRCRKCEVFDYSPVLVETTTGRYLGYNPSNNLMYLDDSGNFNRFGKERIQIVLDRLSEKFNISVPSPQYMSQCRSDL
ncbi:acyltransferase [Ancylostoma duodenale]|uniref:Acyltransferase n=1 Tax=Ancylostoma duodenale TaxID=51022 RepID=A0A0C2H0N6_9BILA|nr:acyltransferase [Ancylostoma duodenale]